MDQSRYRADIDGLRAIAVLGVMLFHIGDETFRGGFVGVDVFFVVSGFLITRMIRDEIGRGVFSFSNFYVRRARRLFPALYFTFVVSFVAAFVLFSPQYLERFGGALLHSVFSVANIYFWQESGYFDVEAGLKPLLHTWSLSVEEQFYLVWPAMLYVLLTKTPRHVVFIVLGAIGLSSLFLTEYFIDSKVAIFYLAPFRGVEFAIGAAMVWLAEHQPRNKLILEPLVVVGLGMIAYAMVTFSGNTAFPGVNALVPCFGTALLMYAGTARYAGRILTNRLAVGIGLISYSLYLIHWPMIVFYKSFNFNELPLFDGYVVISLSVVVAALMYRFVESPFRFRDQGRNRFSAPAFGFVCAMLALVISLPAATVWANEGWEWRFPTRILLAEQEIKREKRKYGNISNPQFDSNRKNLLILGDSQAADVFFAFQEADGLVSRIREVSFRCNSFFEADDKNDADTVEHCKKSFDDLLASEDLRVADFLVYVHFWGKDNKAAYRTAVERIRAVNGDIKIVVFGQRPVLGRKFVTINEITKYHQDLDTLNEYLNSIAWIQRDANADAREMTEALGLIFVDVADVFCDGGCTYYRKPNFAYFDQNHWTNFGRKLFFEKFKRTEIYGKTFSLDQ